MVAESSQFSEFSYDEFELLFTTFDLNGDGVIQKNEMKVFLLKLCGFEDQNLNEMIEMGISPTKKRRDSRSNEDSEEINNLIKLTIIYETF